MIRKPTFALFFGNRGFFPASLISAAREEVQKSLADLGYNSIVMEAGATRHGAVETPAEGAAYAGFLKEHEGEFDGVILSLPNFGDENGAVAALKDANVPILVQAYPDELDKMAPELRRDAFCGKISIMDVFRQNGIKFTALKPHTVAPGTPAFAENVDHFAKVCNVTRSMRRMNVGSIGARTTAFKTVRIDELALQKHGINVETYDLSDIFTRVDSVDANSAVYKDKSETLKAFAGFSGVPGASFDNLVKLGVVLDEIIEEANLDCLAVRCWLEMQKQLRISPCVLLGELNERGIPASCEVDLGNAVAMYALSAASCEPAACLDWNNNYEDDEDKCILFHCGPVPKSLMAEKGNVVAHAILENALEKNSSFGCNAGRIKPMDFTFSSMLTNSGKLEFYVGEGSFTADPIPENFFGCAGVAHIPGLQDTLLYIGYRGHRHHVSVTPGRITEPLYEALVEYLGYTVDVPQAD